MVWVEWLSLAGLGPGGSFGVDVVAGGVRIRFLVRGWWLVRGGVAPGGRWGMRLDRSVAAIPSAGAVRARGVVARRGRAVGSGSGGGGVGSGGGGAAGGGGVGSGGVCVAGMAHGPLVGFFGPPCGGGGLGIVGSPRGCTMWWAGGAGWGPGLTVTVVEGSHVPGSVWPAVVVAFRGMDDGALGDGDADEGLDGVVLGGPLCGGGWCRREGGAGCGGCGVLAWARVRAGVVSGGFVSLRLWCCVCSRGRWLGFGVGFGVWVRFQVEEYLCPEV